MGFLWDWPDGSCRDIWDFGFGSLSFNFTGTLFEFKKASFCLGFKSFSSFGAQFLGFSIFYCLSRFLFKKYPKPFMASFGVFHSFTYLFTTLATNGGAKTNGTIQRYIGFSGSTWCHRCTLFKRHWNHWQRTWTPFKFRLLSLKQRKDVLFRNNQLSSMDLYGPTKTFGIGSHTFIVQHKMNLAMLEAWIDPPTHENSWQFSCLKSWPIEMLGWFIVNQCAKWDSVSFKWLTSVCNFIASQPLFHPFYFIGFIGVNRS